MKETQTEQGAVHKTRSEGKKEVSQTPGTSHELLWGAVLFACMLLFVVASIGGVGWVAYTKWRSERIAKSQPSITVLSERSNEQQEAVPVPLPADNMSAEETSASDSAAAAKKLEISVLNGGTTKGSAGVLADFLKKEGYLKTDIGNTQKDYAGVTLYYATGLEKEAAIIKESVAKKYPQVKILPSDSKNKETAVSQVTIILGR